MKKRFFAFLLIGVIAALVMSAQVQASVNAQTLQSYGYTVSDGLQVQAVAAEQINCMQVQYVYSNVQYVQSTEPIYFFADIGCRHVSEVCTLHINYNSQNFSSYKSWSCDVTDIISYPLLELIK